MENEHLALAKRDYRFTQYHYADNAPGANQRLTPFPPHLPVGGVQLDANPDADTETDFATDTIHPTINHPPATTPRSGPEK
jgi:hypothetical protein